MSAARYPAWSSWNFFQTATGTAVTARRRCQLSAAASARSTHFIASNAYPLFAPQFTWILPNAPGLPVSGPPLPAMAGNGDRRCLR